jgi:hypothetical protein
VLARAAVDDERGGRIVDASSVAQPRGSGGGRRMIVE